jgi:hypothetical protein
MVDLSRECTLDITDIESRTDGTDARSTIDRINAVPTKKEILNVSSRNLRDRVPALSCLAWSDPDSDSDSDSRIPTI